jgi:protein transport protein SEC61 subunit gamma-like protein
MDMRERLRKYSRVLIVARKPTKDELLSGSKICAAGLVFLGLIGFAIFLAFLFAGV